MKKTTLQITLVIEHEDGFDPVDVASRVACAVGHDLNGLAYDELTLLSRVLALGVEGVA